jgi:hypothetical protein
MPIKPENAHRYPKDWRQIRARILERAGDRCEGSPQFPECRVANGHYRRRRDGAVFEDPDHAIACSDDEDLFTQIVLTIAHLDHTLENCDPENLRAWCQRCHLAYDAPLHRESSFKTRHARKAAADLFGL